MRSMHLMWKNILYYNVFYIFIILYTWYISFSSLCPLCYPITLSFPSLSVFLWLPVCGKQSICKGGSTDLSKYTSNLVAKNIYFKGEFLEFVLNGNLIHKLHTAPHGFISKIGVILISAWLFCLTSCQKIEKRRDDLNHIQKP